MGMRSIWTKNSEQDKLLKVESGTQSPRMRILHVTNNYPTLNFPIFGIFIKEQLESLRSIGTDNKVFFINSREEGKIEYLKSLFRLRKYLKTNKFDIIHCHHCFSAVILLLSGRSRSTRRLLSYQSDPRNEGGLVLFWILIRVFDRIILKNKPKETNLRKTVYLPNGVNMDFFVPLDKKECKDKLGLDQEKRYVLFMDSYNRRNCKRIDRYSETLEILRGQYGHNDLEPLVLTNTGRSLIPAYINACDLHILTSDFEGSPNSVKECMACNVPVVSTPVGNVQDLLNGIEGAYVAESFSSAELARLSHQALIHKDFSSRTTVMEKGLDMDTVARRLLDVYSNLINPQINGIKQSAQKLGSKETLPIGAQFNIEVVRRPLRVLLINNCHYRRGGADVVYLNTGDLLETMGHNVAYFSTKSQYNYDTSYSEFFVKDIDALKLSFVEQLAYMPRKLYSIESAIKLKKVIETFKPDVAHIHLYKGGLTASILPVLRKEKLPAVITLHDYSLLCPRNTFIDGDGNICETCLTKTRLNCIYKRCNRKNFYYSTINYIEFVLNNDILKPEDYFSKIICVSKFNYHKHSSHRLFNERFIHLYNFYPALSINIPNTKKGKYFLFYGRLVPEKGVKTILDTWNRFGDEIVLKIIGGGAMSDQIAMDVKTRNRANIEFLGFKKGEELFNYIRNASFVLVPSEWYENNPLTIVEAYSAGKPVIGSNIGGIPELIEDGKTGFLFEMGDSYDLEAKVRMAQAISEEKYREMSEMAYRVAFENFSEKSHYEELLNIYTEAIRDRSSSMAH